MSDVEVTFTWTDQLTGVRSRAIGFVEHYPPVRVVDEDGAAEVFDGHCAIRGPRGFMYIVPLGDVAAPR